MTQNVTTEKLPEEQRPTESLEDVVDGDVQDSGELEGGGEYAVSIIEGEEVS